ncbi:unnamed protein product [Fraxinus pennsylvanica]|uniref:Uncharacterized protein n=1 Tax=Fraxinus pennsylvanica TaxID=56036 RepID=A0AAD2DUV1_9LAMI|nr:unnamed protein product [Fraxinus pennsylvanica]
MQQPPKLTSGKLQKAAEPAKTEVANNFFDMISHVDGAVYPWVNHLLLRVAESAKTEVVDNFFDMISHVDGAFYPWRIVIKLLVTYFQRNHSKEVLDLMVRMLGFSDEDKQRIGVAQQGAGKGVVRGVLGLPGRLVGGIMGGGSAEAPTTMASEDQSFANLWVDFLLKETVEREKRESADTANGSNREHKGSPNPIGSVSPLSDQKGDNVAAAPTFSRSNPFQNQNRSPEPSRGNFLKSEHSDSEFSTVPLTSSESNSKISRLLPRY